MIIIITITYFYVTPPGLYNARAVTLSRTWNILQCTETYTGRERAAQDVDHDAFN